MRNFSKKTKKKLLKVLNSHCHCTKTCNDSIMTFYPYTSSPLSSIWKYLTKRPDGVLVGRFLVQKYGAKVPLNAQYRLVGCPEQLFNPRAHIEINKQIVNRLQERDQLYAINYTWRKAK